MHIPPIIPMHKASRIIGMSTAAVAGAVGTYFYMKPKLRKDLRKAHSAGEAANLIGHELEHDALIAAGKAMDAGSEGLHRISTALSPRPMAMQRARRHRRTAMKTLQQAKKAATHAAAHTSSK